MMDSKYYCGECRFYNPGTSETDVMVKVGSCQRHAPKKVKATQKVSDFSQWARVWAEDGCGEFEASEQQA